MALINYTTNIDLDGGYVKVQWPGLAAGDEGEPFDCAGLNLASIQYAGTFGGGHVQMRASNEVSPTNFAEIHDSSTPVMQVVFGTVTYPAFGTVKPVALTGVSGVTVAALFLRAR